MSTTISTKCAGASSCDERDRNFYSDDQYIRDILTQLKLAPAEIFAKRFEEVEMDWMVGKKALNPVVLMTEAATLYRQLKQTNKWDGQLHPRDQVVVLQTTVTALTSKVQELQNKLSSKPAGNANDSTSSDRGAGTKTVKEFDKRRLTKVENGREFNAIFWTESSTGGARTDTHGMACRVACIARTSLERATLLGARELTNGSKPTKNAEQSARS